jgi:hypothetical protein
MRQMQAGADRETLLYPTLIYKDQLAQLQTVSDQNGEAMAKLIRLAIDAYLARERPA